MYYIGQEHEDQKNGVGFLAILLVTSLFNLCIHLSILRMRFVSGMNTVLVIDEITSVFEPSAKPAIPYPRGAPSLPTVHD